jgi:D-alanyl-D-alanine carboxypeptidase
MSRKERARRRRIITITVTAVVAVVIIVAAALLIKSCAGKKNTDAADNNAISETTQNVNNNSNNSVSSTQAESTENKSTEAATDNASDGKEKTSKGFTIETRNGATYIDGYLIANKTYALPSTFIPENPEVPVTEARSNTSLDKDLMTAFRKMQADATAKGLNIYIASGYRSYDYQVSLYNRYVANDGKAAADTYSSRPGNSEHQTGLCFDLNSIEDSFQYTNEGKWINDNCYKYGFCIRFPKGKDAYTGYQYESWHLRYVGEELAEKLYNNGDWISLEEYFGITSEYPN